jgi:hypothetical protein
MDSGHRWLGVGRGAGVDPRTAGREAARQALRGDDPALLIVFAARVDDPAAMLAGIEEACPGVPLVGCSAEYLVTPAEGDLVGVVVTALGGPGFTVRTAAGSCADGAQRAGGAAVARCVADLDGAVGGHQRVLMMLTDGSVADQEEIVAGAYGVIGASVPMIGGSASAEPYRDEPYQLHGREVLRQGAVGAVIASDGPLGFGMRHGCRTVGEPMIVTRSVKGDVHTLDDQPAVTAYLERFDAPQRTYTDPRTFEDFAQRRPIGIRRRHGVEVRAVTSSVGLANGRLRASGEVPEGGLVWLMEGDEESALDAAGQACRQAVDGLGDAPPLGVMAFDCVSRFHLLGAAGLRLEAGRMVEQCDGGPLVGLYTWGEIMRTRGLNGYHNHTVAVLAVG